MDDKKIVFIKEQTKKYGDVIDSCDDYIDDFDTILHLIKKQYPNDNTDDISNFIKIVESDLKTSENLKKITEELIKTLQSQCEHVMKYYGNDSHHTYERCIYCGFEGKY